MKDWLEENLNGLKDVFEKYFKAFSENVRKVSNATVVFLFLLF
jgi:hypothetical protein